MPCTCWFDPPEESKMKEENFDIDYFMRHMTQEEFDLYIQKQEIFPYEFNMIRKIIKERENDI